MNRIGKAALGGLLLAASCTAPAKQDVSQLPVDPNDDGKADSLRKPVLEGPLKVGEAGEGDFTATRGWIAYDVQLTAGPVDVFLHGRDRDDQPLDTVVYVFGPQRPDGKYPSWVLDLNDDGEPGDVGSWLQLEVPEDGVYRVVASTYDNYFTWPFNVSRGAYTLNVKCPRDGLDACGPAIHYVGQSCWVDADCVTGAHCEGEITCAPGTECLWVREGQCVEDYQWLALQPRQCGENPWQREPAAGDGVAPSYPDEELLAVDNWLESQGVDLLELGFAWQVDPDPTCLACVCPRGDRLLVKARTNDALRLAAEFGFTAIPAQAWWEDEPRQCGANPWTAPAGATPRDEVAAVATWAAGEGAPLVEVGFTYRTEAFAVCEACSCPRGDRVVVLPEGVGPVLGYQDVYAP